MQKSGLRQLRYENLCLLSSSRLRYGSWGSPLYRRHSPQLLFTCEHYFLALHRLAVFGEVVHIHTLGQTVEVEASFGR